MTNKSKRSKHLNNKGFSLIELMVTIAIMAVMIGAGITTYRTVSRSNVKKAARYVDDSLSMAREKAKTISAYEWNMTIDATGKNIVLKLVRVDKIDPVVEGNDPTYESTVMNTTTLPSNTKLKLVDVNGSETLVGKDETINQVSIAFKSLTGGVGKIYLNGDASNVMPQDKFYIDIVSYYKSKAQSVRLYYVTGKHTTSAF